MGVQREQRAAILEHHAAPGTTMPEPNEANRLWIMETTLPSWSTAMRYTVLGWSGAGAPGGAAGVAGILAS